MSKQKSTSSPKLLLARDDFQVLLDLLAREGYHVLGPTTDGRGILYEELTSVDQLPVGYTEKQDGGSYQLVKSSKQTLFGFSVGHQSLKRYLHPAEEAIWSARRESGHFAIEETEPDDRRRAFIGVRACDLAALAIHDKVLTQGPYANAAYKQRRRNTLIVAVNCTQPGGTCFCASMGTGPEVKSGYDIALTEVVEKDHHYFILRSGSDAGEKIVNELPTRDANKTEIEAATAAVKQASGKMGRRLDTKDLKEKLYACFDDPHWEKISDRCLSCGNCTMVCPTCFCVNVEDVTDLTGEHAERRSRWDSCYTVDFSYIHGGSIRNSTMSRYRQWLEHKLAYWMDQFGTFGCVGCGRCITWCPVGIDITEEARAICEKR
jgi:sulfhydrogenase subunit beta (sulfur reductase)